MQKVLLLAFITLAGNMGCYSVHQNNNISNNSSNMITDKQMQITN